MLKPLFYISATLFLLALTAYLVAANPVWQRSHPKIAGVGFIAAPDQTNWIYTMDTNGNLYARPMADAGRLGAIPDSTGRPIAVAAYVGNFWDQSAHR